MNLNLNRNLSMLTDFYELTMANGYLCSGLGNQIVYFDMFFRRVPDGGGFAIMCGLEQFIEYIEQIKFSKDDIQYLRDKAIFSEEFLDYLSNFKFSCDIWAVPEGSVIFPGEPIITVRGPIIQAQLIETMMLICINHQSLIATKANRIVRAAQGRSIMEFGARRAQGADAALYGSRAAYIGGCCGTSCTLAEKMFGIPAMGTMAHSWIQMFDSEFEAFKAYAMQYPDNCMLLVDTYNTLKSGVPNAIKTFNEVLLPMGKRPVAIRIDSGDITYLSKKARKMLDQAGYKDCKICASNSLDEYIIRDMILQGAEVDIFGIGERMITAASEPVFGGVYKLVGIEQDGVIFPKIKLSENVSKITTPCFKNLWRLYDNDTNKAVADVLTMYDEHIDNRYAYEIFDPEHIWKRKKLKNFSAINIRKKVFNCGKRCYNTSGVKELQNYANNQIASLWDEVKRFENPHKYYVDLSEELWQVKQKLINTNMF